MNKDGVCKLADFGLSRTIHQPLRTYTPEIMTMNYKPPELFFGETHYVSNIDVWSAGCIMGEMLRGRAMFSGECDLDMLFDIFTKMGSPKDKETRAVYANLQPLFWKAFPDFQPPRIDVFQSDFGQRIDNNAMDLMKKLLDLHPTRRIPAREALKHPWFSDIPGIFFRSKKIRVPTSRENPQEKVHLMSECGHHRGST